MAHKSTLTGGVSESIAAAMFLANGFSVATALVPELYDMIVTGKDEAGDDVRFTVQVKTIKVRSDREGQLVVRGANASGIPYSEKDVDYILGVHLPTSTGFLIRNSEQSEYWAANMETARKKWTELRLSE